MGYRYSNVFCNNLFSAFNRRSTSTYLLTMSGFGDNTITLLIQRLTKAERRLKLLTREIKDIRSKLHSHSYVNDVNTRATPENSRQDSITKRQTETDGASANKRQCLDLPTDGGYVVVYTDGACENNGKIGAKAGVGVWFAADHPLNVSKPVTGRATNNTAEIQACICALEIIHCKGFHKAIIRTDSQFVIKSMTQWILRWKLNNWKIATGGEVKNKKDFVTLDNLSRAFDEVKWEYIPGHQGLTGNTEADSLARAGAQQYIG